MLILTLLLIKPVFFLLPITSVVSKVYFRLDQGHNHFLNLFILFYFLGWGWGVALNTKIVVLSVWIYDNSTNLSVHLNISQVKYIWGYKSTETSKMEIQPGVKGRLRKDSMVKSGLKILLHFCTFAIKKKKKKNLFSLIWHVATYLFMYITHEMCIFHSRHRKANVFCEKVYNQQ